MDDNKAQDHLNQALIDSQFKFGQYLEEVLELWKKQILAYIGFASLTLAASLTLSSIPTIGPLLSSLFIGSCLSLGGYFYSDALDRNENPDFGKFFEGFQYISKIVLQNLIIFGLALMILTPIVLWLGIDNIAALGTPEGLAKSPIKGSFLLAMVPFVYFLMLTSFALPLLTFYNLQPMEALIYSARFVNKHFILLIVFFVFCGIFILSGLLAFIVGILVTFSFLAPLNYVVFKDLTNLDGYRFEPAVQYTGATLDDFR
jgi:hypothetical protein